MALFENALFLLVISELFENDNEIFILIIPNNFENALSY
jgi:hypothetical protein